MFAINGEITPPCGVPRVVFLPPLVRRCPRSSVSSTGAFSHILMRCSIFLSLMRRATHCISSVRDTIEIPRKIGVYYFGASFLDRVVDCSNRIERTALGTVPEGRLIEVRFENRFKYQRRCGFYYPVPDSGNSERALAHAAGLGNHHPSHRLRSVASCSNLLPQCAEPLFHPLCIDAVKGFSVHTGRAAVRTAAGVGVGEDVFTPHFVIQAVEPSRRLLLGLHVERSLERPDLFRSCQAHANLLTSARSSAPRTRAPFLRRHCPA